MQSRIEALLAEWRPRTTAKQRITGSRLHRQLVEEGFQVGVTTVRICLRELRRRTAEVFVPLVHRPGEGQVDFFEVTVDVGGERRKVWKFVLRLMYSGRDFVWLYDSCDQLIFLDGHVRAFSWLGWVPTRLVYDNLSAAVKRRVGLERELTERHGLCAVSIHHRLGRVEIGEASVVIAVSAPHRSAALDACREAIETLKTTIPLWKKEVYAGGEEWIGRGS